jgi:hypothetical protein
MSTTRLTFLYPHLFRSIRASEPVAQAVRTRAPLTPRQCQTKRGFSSAERRAQPKFVQRHGKAVEPFLMDGESAEGLKVFTPETPEEVATDLGKIKKPKNQSQDFEAKETTKSTPEEEESKPSSAAPLSEETQAASELPGDKDTVGAGKNGASKDELTPRQQAAANTSDPFAPLETVLQMPPPETQEEENASKPPHLQTPPYVHHFDTYTLVQQVEAGDFTAEQAITAMKAVRGLLALNLDVAQAGLVSKSDVENVSLFTLQGGELILIALPL